MTQATQTARRLSDAERASYDANGYLIVHNVLDRDELASLNAELHELWLARAADPKLTDEEVNNIHGLGATSAQSKNLAGDERILNLIDSLVQPGISLFSAKMISKAPNQAHMVCHWHQDDAYWQHISESHCRLSVWIPLQDTNVDNGCLRVVPGSHRPGLVPHEPRSSRDHGSCRLSFLPGEADIPGAVDCIVPAGSVVIFHAKTQHSSPGNKTAEHRRAFIITYQEATAKAGKAGEFTVLRPA